MDTDPGSAPVLIDDSLPVVTIAVPCLNQGRFLDHALASIFDQAVPVEVFVADGGSTDNTLKVISKWEACLAGWRSHRDAGQAAAINESIALGQAPYVCWLNSDDWLLPGGLQHLVDALEINPRAPAVYGKVYNKTGKGLQPVRVEPFDPQRLAVHCIVSQPGSLIRRSSWERIGGLLDNLHMALDYDLWWRLYKSGGPLLYIDTPVAVNRDHPFTKTNRHRRRHYREAMAVVKRHHGSLPLKWWLAQPYAVWFRGLQGWWQRTFIP